MNRLLPDPRRSLLILLASATFHLNPVHQIYTRASASASASDFRKLLSPSSLSSRSICLSRRDRGDGARRSRRWPALGAVATTLILLHTPGPAAVQWLAAPGCEEPQRSCFKGGAMAALVVYCAGAAARRPSCEEPQRSFVLKYLGIMSVDLRRANMITSILVTSYSKHSLKPSNVYRQDRGGQLEFYFGMQFAQP